MVREAKHPAQSRNLLFDCINKALQIAISFGISNLSINRFLDYAN